MPREELYLQEAGCNRRINKMAYQRKLGRTAAQRKALLRNQVTNLIWYGRIETLSLIHI